MALGGDWLTPDPLGIGGLLMDAARLAQLMQQGRPIREELVERIAACADQGLVYSTRQPSWREPAHRRLGFRELGLAIGLEAVSLARQDWAADSSLVPGGVRAACERLLRHRDLADAIVSFWLEPQHQDVASWTEHLDINEIMLATALAPEGAVLLPQPGGARRQAPER
jgi:hypothetical protein